MSTMAEQWVSEGFQKGIHEGIKLATFKMLQAGICCSEISKIIGLSKMEIKNLDDKHCNFATFNYKKFSFN